MVIYDIMVLETNNGNKNWKKYTISYETEQSQNIAEALKRKGTYEDVKIVEREYHV